VSGLVLEGFAGPGGASEGMRQLGLDPIGVEWDEAACATRRAAGHRTIRADVASFPLEHLAGKVEGVWLSPPCPTLSSAGKGAGREDMPWLLSFLERVYRTGAWHDPWEWHQWKDARTPLSLEPVRWVLTLNPEWVCLEQVPEALPIWESIAAVLEQQGYSCWTGVLCAADHGVPQKRHRAVLLASRVRKVMPPEPTHAENPEPSLFGGELARWVSMDVALGWSGVDETAPTITGGGGFSRWWWGAPDPHPRDSPAHHCAASRRHATCLRGLRGLRGPDPHDQGPQLGVARRSTNDLPWPWRLQGADRRGAEQPSRPDARAG
jgi:DNA (cytosine-5)-methyltransferase 1